MSTNPPSGNASILPVYNTRAPGTIHDPGTIPDPQSANRLPFLNWTTHDVRNHFVATSAEFTGTTLFLLFAFSGTQVALLSSPLSNNNIVGSKSDPAQLLYIALSFGFSLAVNAWVFFRISGGLFNPAVTFGMCLVGVLPYIRGILLTISQILGGIAAAAIVSILFPGPFTVQTSLAGGTTILQGLFIEMFLTAELVFAIFMLAAEKHKATFVAPVGIGLALFIAELTGVYFTGGSVNPARSFGPSVVNRSFHSYHWIYWVGPILGSLIASGFYKFIKMLEYETANPGQDATRANNEHTNPSVSSSPQVVPVSFAPSNSHGAAGNTNINDQMAGLGASCTGSTITENETQEMRKQRKRSIGGDDVESAGPVVLAPGQKTSLGPGTARVLDAASVETSDRLNTHDNDHASGSGTKGKMSFELQ